MLFYNVGILVDVVTDLARDGVLGELLYTGDLLLVSEVVERHWNGIVGRRWLLRVGGNLWKAIVIVSKSIV